MNSLDVYCDESRHDLLASLAPNASYTIIGSLWIPTALRERCKNSLHRLRDLHKMGGEFKWSKISPSREKFYLDFIEWFFRCGEDVRFRCICVNREKLDLSAFHENDQELGFYKFYYQLLNSWIHENCMYNIFCDYKNNRYRDRLADLRKCLNNSNMSSIIRNVQSVRSKESVLIQSVDVLTGCVSSYLNGELREGSTKSKVVSMICERLGKQIGPTNRAENKFNVFIIKLR